MTDLKIEIKTLHPTKDNIKVCECIRYDSIGQKIPDEYLLNSKCASRILDAEILIFAMYVEDILAAGCYVSDSFDTLFIEQLFVKKEFQETGLYLGRRLLTYVLENRETVERYFHYHPTESELFFTSNKSKNIYEKIGYKTKEEKTNLMSKGLPNIQSKQL